MEDKNKVILGFLLFIFGISFIIAIIDIPNYWEAKRICDSFKPEWAEYSSADRWNIFGLGTKISCEYSNGLDKHSLNRLDESFYVIYENEQWIKGVSK